MSNLDTQSLITIHNTILQAIKKEKEGDKYPVVTPNNITLPKNRKVTKPSDFSFKFKKEKKEEQEAVRLFGVLLYHLSEGESEYTKYDQYAAMGFYYRPKNFLADIVEKMTSRGVLFDGLEEIEESVVGLESSEEVSDKETEIQKQDNELQAQESSEQAALAKIAFGNEKDKDWGIRLVAVGKITDQAILTKIAFGDEKDGKIYVRKAATERITDQVSLAKIAFGDQKDKDWYVRQVAAARITKLQNS